MSLRFTPMEIPDVILAEPVVHGDGRGFFLETYHEKKYQDGGIKAHFVQDNLSHSIKKTLRGLHYQLRSPQAKLVTCLTGEIFDVAVDIRPKSPSFGKWIGVILSGENKRQIYIPEGFAHGFCVLSETADVFYKCSGFYEPSDDYGILFSDPALEIPWPIKDPILSDKDRKFPILNEAAKRNYLPA